MDGTEPYNWVLDTVIRYSTTIGVAAIDDMGYINERVGFLFQLTV